VDGAGNVYVADSGNSALRKITSSGTVSTLQLTAGSPQFNNPYGIAIDGSGTLYVADTFANAIRSVSPSGAVSTLAGSSRGTSGSVDATGGAALFSGPSSIVLSNSGTIYVTESGNSIVRSISNSFVSTIAGTASGTGTVDGSGTYAYFDAPQGVAVGPDGALYVCDTLNSTIRKLVRNQVATTTPALPTPSDPSVRFINISTRSYVGTGGDILIGGFIIGGTTPKTVLIRANGPALASQGIAATDVLADPVLTLFSGSTTIATNDNWGDDPSNAAAVAQANQTYNTNWPSNSKDAALVMTLAPGGYTAQVSGKNNTTGIALIEVFELTSDGGSRLINISTRSRVQTGAGVQIAGFIITGSSPKNVLIRAGGPFLSAFFPNNPGAVLSDPVLQLYQGSTVIATNDNWSSDSTHADVAQQAFAAAGAVPYSVGSKDAVLVMTLAPGGYTAIVSGKDGAQGIALIEVDELP
jgi:sugar lactone lactonase YvrE